MGLIAAFELPVLTWVTKMFEAIRISLSPGVNFIAFLYFAAVNLESVNFNGRKSMYGG